MDYTGEQITLRPLKESDLQLTVKWKNDPRIRDNVLGYRFPVTDTMEKRWFDIVGNDNTHTKCVYAIEENISHSFIGYVQLSDIDWISRCCYFGISIGDKQNQNKGYGKEATTLILKQAFEVLNIRKVLLHVLETNTNAINLYTKLGFEKEGVLKRQVYSEGCYQNIVIMSIFSPFVDNNR